MLPSSQQRPVHLQETPFHQRNLGNEMICHYCCRLNILSIIQVDRSVYLSWLFVWFLDCSIRLIDGCDGVRAPPPILEHLKPASRGRVGKTSYVLLTYRNSTLSYCSLLCRLSLLYSPSAVYLLAVLLCFCSPCPPPAAFATFATTLLVPSPIIQS